MTVKRKKWIIAILGFVFAFLMFIPAIISAVANVGKNVNLQGEIKFEYSRGTNFIIPKATISSDNGEILLDSTIIYPDGRKSSYDTCTLDECGVYTIHYYLNGEVKKTVNFSVVDDYSSMFSYGNNIILEEQTNVPDYLGDDYKGSDSGVKFTFKENGATLKYNGVIDLRDINFTADTNYITRTESTGVYYDYNNKEFIELLVTPKDNTVKELNNIQIVLTDIYDESNYIRINLTAGDKKFMYPASLYAGVTAKDMYNPTAYTEYDPGHYGTCEVKSSFYGKSGSTGACSLKLFMDPVSSALWGSPITVLKYERLLMHAFNNPDVVGLKNVWEGFTTGEVYLSITANELLKDECSIMLLSVGGKKLGSNYKNGEHVISVNYQDYSADSLPYGVAGENMTYPVFDAIAYNTVGGMQKNLVTQVFYGDDMENVVITDGVFKTEKAGTYYIKYSLDNYYGKCEKIVPITVKEKYDDKDELSYLISDQIADVAKIKQKVIVPMGEIVGGVGKVSESVCLSFRQGAGDWSIKEMYSNDSARWFNTDLPGEYKLSFTVTDMLGKTFSVEKIISVAYDEVPQMANLPIPKYVIKGYSYTFPKPEVMFMDASGNKDIELKITVNGQDYTDKVFVANEDFTVVYRASLKEDNTKYTECSYSIKVIDLADETTPFITKFFESSDVNGDQIADFTLTPDKKHTILSTEVDKASVRFVNPLSFDLFNIVFKADETASNFSAINIYLTDSENASQIIKLSINKVEKSGRIYSMFSLNDNMLCNIEGSFDGSSTLPFSLSYNRTDNSIYDESGTTLCNIDYFLNGDQFNGFSSGKVYMKIELEGVTEQSQIFLMNISNQQFNESYLKDKTAPQLVYEFVIPGSSFGLIGQSFAVPSAIAYDVLSQISQTTLTVTSPRGSRGDIFNGSADQSFTFTPDKVGSYTIIYSAMDTAGKKMSNKIFYLFVQEVNAPEITINDSLNEYYNIGDSIEIPSFTVVDDTDANPVKFVYIETPGYTQILVEVGESYTFTEKGTYKINYYSRDEYCNYAIKTVKVIVDV